MSTVSAVPTCSPLSPSKLKTGKRYVQLSNSHKYGYDFFWDGKAKYTGKNSVHTGAFKLPSIAAKPLRTRSTSTSHMNHSNRGFSVAVLRSR